jgi:predicted GNAT family N-acyltransferase
MELSIRFDLPAVSTLPMLVRVAWVHATDETAVRFGVQCVDLDWDLQTRICGFLMDSRQWTPARLRESGFHSEQIKSLLRFRSVKSMEDYGEVLRLRRDAYVGVGKRPEGTCPEDMATALDGSSRIQMAHHRDQLVGTLTFTFPGSEELVLDSQSGFPGQKYPVTLPPKANLIEVSRLCIHADYRGTDLLQGMFEQGLKHFLMSDRHWLITSAVDDLVPLYKRIGFRKLNAKYKHPRLNFQEHHLLLAHKNAFLWGQGMNPFLWNALFGDLVKYLLDRNLIEIPVWARALIRCQLLLKPVSKRILEARARGGFKKHLAAIRNLRVPSQPPAASPGPDAD